MIAQRKTDPVISKHTQALLSKIDHFGSIFIKILYETILNRKTLINDIRKMLTLQAKDAERNSISFYEYLFILDGLNATASELVHLLDLITDRLADTSQTSRKELTICYLKNYSDII